MPANSDQTYSGSQLYGCDGWMGGDPTTEQGWRITIVYINTDSSDHLRLSSRHVYFTLDVDSEQGLFCPMSHHDFVNPGDYNETFNCQWSTI